MKKFSGDIASAMSPTPTSATSTTLPASTTSSSKTESPSSTSTDDMTSVEMYADDPCSGTLHTWSLKPGSSGCRVVDADKRSILVRSNQYVLLPASHDLAWVWVSSLLTGMGCNRGCNVTTWSSPTCNGSSFKVQDSSCHNVLYAAVSYSC